MRKLFFRQVGLVLGLAMGVAYPAQAQTPTPAAEIILPEVLSRVDAESPVGRLHREAISTVLFVTVDTNGSVARADVSVSGGEAFDKAAVNAVMQWRFAPARRRGIPVEAKISVPFIFPPNEVAESIVPISSENSAANAGTGASAESSATQAPKANSALQSQQKDAGLIEEHSSASQAAKAQSPSVPPPLPAQEPAEVIVQGRYRAPTRGVGDFHIDVGQLSNVPRKNAAAMLQLAPGILLTNEGGVGHAEQVFLRGFDAREGQDIEFTVGGVPINEAGNLHGNGHADTHFIIPETVLALRVLEGPFDPRQGNFAAAGSADYLLGLERRGVTLKAGMGSFGSQRLLLLYGPAELSRCTFGAAELYKTDGFGQNRDAQRASAMAQYEGRFGGTGSYRVTGQGYAADYHSAGVLREDDYRAHKVGFYDSYDTRQGGDSARYSISADLEERIDRTLFREQLYVVRRSMGMRKNYTGFLLDVQEPTQNPHSQRGDLVSLAVDSFTIGSRGAARTKESFLGQDQELEVGYHARGDFGSGSQMRLQASNGVPYLREVDLDYTLGDLGLYADANLKFLSWLGLRGGLRGNFFSYGVLDKCAQKSVRQPSRSNPPGDASCHSQQDMGLYREPVQRSTTATTALLPRASLLVTPLTGLVFSTSYGEGIRSIDPIYISQDKKTPFARVRAYEAGVLYSRTLENVQFVARTAAFRTHVSQDLIFSETSGRNTLADGTTRLGALGAVRITGSFFDQSLNATVVRSRFDDTGLVIPYVPDLVVRSDTAFYRDLPLKLAGSRIKGTMGAGITYVGRRPLPYNELSDRIFTVDAAASASWKGLELAVESTNLFNRKYRLGEYNYASDFLSAAQPTLVPVRHFSAGPPRSVFVSLAVTLGATR